MPQGAQLETQHSDHPETSRPVSLADFSGILQAKTPY